MAAIPLDPNGKYILSTNVLWQSTVLQAANEKARDLVIANNTNPPATWNLEQAKRDERSRSFMMQPLTTIGSFDAQAKVFSLLARFDDPNIMVDPENMNANVSILYEGKPQGQNFIDEWYDIQCLINAGDSGRPAPNYPPLHPFEAQPTF